MVTTLPRWKLKEAPLPLRSAQKVIQYRRKRVVQASGGVERWQQIDGHQGQGRRLARGAGSAQQVGEQPAYLRAVRSQMLSAALNDADEVPDSLLKVIVDHHVVELVPVGHVAYRILKAPGDHCFTIRTTIPEAILQGLSRRRQNEYSYALGK